MVHYTIFSPSNQWKKRSPKYGDRFVKQGQSLLVVPEVVVAVVLAVLLILLILLILVAAVVLLILVVAIVLLVLVIVLIAHFYSLSF